MAFLTISVYNKSKPIKSLMSKSTTNKMFTTFEEIQSWLEVHQVSNYLIHDDLTVSVNGDVNLSYHDLSFLPIQFYKIKGDLFAHKNKLKTLYGFPQEVESITCYSNQLTSLEGAPKIVDGVFNASLNPLKTLKGIPHYIESILMIDAKKLLDYSAIFAFPTNDPSIFIENMPLEMDEYFNSIKTISKKDLLIYLERKYLESQIQTNNQHISLNKIKL